MLLLLLLCYNVLPLKHKVKMSTMSDRVSPSVTARTEANNNKWATTTITAQIGAVTKLMDRCPSGPVGSVVAA